MSHLKICGIAPHLRVHGGVRRYMEMGNALVKAGHSYTLYVLDEPAHPWIPFLGRVAHIDELESKPEVFDLAFTGAEECFGPLLQVNALKKAVLVVAKFYAEEYKKLWRDQGSNLLWIGVAEEWNKGMEEIAGVRCPGGINLDYFRPAGERVNQEKLLVTFYARSGGTIRGDDMLAEVIAGAGGLAQFIGFDTVTYLPVNIPGTSVLKTLYQEEMVALLQKSDIVLSCMGTAGWNNVAAEGMACGAVPVTTPAGVKDFIVDGQNGFICDTAQEMIEQIEMLAANRNILERMRAQGRESLKPFTWDRFVSRMLDIVKNYQNPDIKSPFGEAHRPIIARPFPPAQEGGILMPDGSICPKDKWRPAR